MHRFYSLCRSFFLPCLAFVSVALAPGLAAASPVHDFHTLGVYIKHEFLAPLAVIPADVSEAHRTHVVRESTTRPTQGGNVLTATDCSMTRSFDGILDNDHGGRDAVVGSVGLAV